jgi:hypothetical protein
MLCGSLIALVKAIWTPVVFFIVSAQVVVVPDGENHHETASRQAADLLLGGILVVTSPLLLKKDLHALRNTCYVGFSSCVLLMLAVVYRACEKLSHLPRTVRTSRHA